MNPLEKMAPVPRYASVCLSTAVPLVTMRTVGCSANVRRGVAISPERMTCVVISGGLNPNASTADPRKRMSPSLTGGILNVMDSEVNPPENRVPNPPYTSTNLSSAIPLTGTTPNGCSANVRRGVAISP